MVTRNPLPASASFADYFKMGIPPDEILAQFGYGFARERLALPHSDRLPANLEELRINVQTAFENVDFESEMARREFLIAPVLLAVAREIHSKVRVEWELRVSEQLRGTLDYLLQLDGELLIIEAKNADLTRGGTQLCVEMLALAEWRQFDKPAYFGAVSIGDVWQFAMLHTAEKRIVQDTRRYAFPQDDEALFGVLFGILEGKAIT